MFKIMRCWWSLLREALGDGGLKKSLGITEEDLCDLKKDQQGLLDRSNDIKRRLQAHREETLLSTEEVLKSMKEDIVSEEEFKTKLKDSLSSRGRP